MAGGNVGIGTTAPTAALDVSGTIKSNGNPVVTTATAGGLKIVSGKTAFTGCTTSWFTINVTYTGFSTAPTCTATPFSNQTNGGSIQYQQGNAIGTLLEPTTTGFYYSMVCDSNPNKFSGNLHWICVGQ